MIIFYYSSQLLEIIIMEETVIEISAPDDFHHHLRDDDYLKDTVQHAERQFARIVNYFIFKSTLNSVVLISLQN